MKQEANGPIAPVLAAGSAALLAVLAYYDVLSYWFTGTDTIPLIETSRVSSVAGAIGIFVQPLMGGTAFTDRALFYRPVASLSYALDYWVWGTDPFGYHLTDVALHAAAAALVVALVYAVLDDVLTATVAGWLFAVHPLSVEVVPTSARRHDVLATVFVLLALWSFVRAMEATSGGERENRTGSTGAAASRVRVVALVCGSVVCYLLALGSKEVSVIVPALVGAWFLASVYGRRASLGTTTRIGTVVLGPYAVATAAYLAVRYVVLGGLGGYDRPMGALTAHDLAVTVSRYVLSLLYPVDFVGALSRFDPQLISNAFFVVLAGTSLLVAHTVTRNRTEGSVLVSARGRLLALSGVWFVVPVALFVRTGRYTLRSGYVSIVPVAVVLAVLLVTSGRDLRVRLVERRVRTRTSSTRSSADRDASGNANRRDANTNRDGNANRKPQGAPTHTASGGPALVTFLVVCVLCVSLVAGSALVNPYDQWKHAGETSEATLYAISGATQGVPANAAIDVSSVPHPRSARRMGSFPYPKSVTFVWGNTIESWLRLQGRAGSRDVYINDTVVLSETPRSVSATALHDRRDDRDGRDGHVTLAMRYNERCRPAAASNANTTIARTAACRPGNRSARPANERSSPTAERA